MIQINMDKSYKYTFYLNNNKGIQIEISVFAETQNDAIKTIIEILTEQSYSKDSKWQFWLAGKKEG